MYAVFSLNLEKFNLTENFYTGTARGARDKYEVCFENMKILENVKTILETVKHEVVKTIGCQNCFRSI